jgi:hypothetical protein
VTAVTSKRYVSGIGWWIDKRAEWAVGVVRTS